MLNLQYPTLFYRHMHVMMAVRKDLSCVPKDSVLLFRMSTETNERTCRDKSNNRRTHHGPIGSLQTQISNCGGGASVRSAQSTLQRGTVGPSKYICILVHDIHKDFIRSQHMRRGRPSARSFRPRLREPRSAWGRRSQPIYTKISWTDLVSAPRPSPRDSNREPLPTASRRGSAARGTARDAAAVSAAVHRPDSDAPPPAPGSPRPQRPIAARGPGRASESIRPRWARIRTAVAGPAVGGPRPPRPGPAGPGWAGRRQ